MRNLVSTASLVLCLASAAIAASPQDRTVPDVVIRDGDYEGRTHFVVETKRATYWLDKKAGGLSRLIDTDGNDWIGFKREPWDQYPQSAASAYRGLPNLLFGKGHRESGFGHPGWDRGSSQQIDDHTIVCTSESGQWRIRWTFTASDVHLAVEKTLTNVPYWFLYEGPIAGKWSPDQQYFATNTLGPITKPKDYFAGERHVGRWRWAYFGDARIRRVLFIMHEQADQQADTFSFLGDSKQGLTSSNGMVVFGFGRGPRGIDPRLTHSQSFRIGLLEQSGRDQPGYRSIAAKLNSLIPTKD